MLTKPHHWELLDPQLFDNNYKTQDGKFFKMPKIILPERADLLSLQYFL